MSVSVLNGRQRRAYRHTVDIWQVSASTKRFTKNYPGEPCRLWVDQRPQLIILQQTKSQDTDQPWRGNFALNLTLRAGDVFKATTGALSGRYFTVKGQPVPLEHSSVWLVELTEGKPANSTEIT